MVPLLFYLLYRPLTNAPAVWGRETNNSVAPPQAAMRTLLDHHKMGDSFENRENIVEGLCHCVLTGQAVGSCNLDVMDAVDAEPDEKQYRLQPSSSGAARSRSAASSAHQVLEGWSPASYESEEEAPHEKEQEAEALPPPLAAAAPHAEAEAGASPQHLAAEPTATQKRRARHKMLKTLMYAAITEARESMIAKGVLPPNPPGHKNKTTGAAARRRAQKVKARQPAQPAARHRAQVAETAGATTIGHTTAGTSG